MKLKRTGVAKNFDFEIQNFELIIRISELALRWVSITQPMYIPETQNHTFEIRISFN